MSAKQRVLFVCTHNSARSQMAEAFLRELAGDRFDVASAGTEARGVHPLAVQAMAEQGIDISLQKSKTVDRFLEQRFDLVITVCDDAAEACPVFPNAAERRHWSFPDPSAVLGDAEQRFAAFASARDAIRERVKREIIAEDVATGTR
jgi:arsenate reductase